MRLRAVLFVVALVATVFAAAPASALPGDTVRTVHVRGEDASLNPIEFGAAGVATLKVCDDSAPTPVCNTYPVPASGDVQAVVDSARAYTATAIAYKVFSTTATALVGNTTMTVPGAGPPRSFSGQLTVNLAIESDSGISLCPYNPPAPAVCNGDVDIFGFVNPSGLATVLGNSRQQYLYIVGAETLAKTAIVFPVAVNGTAPFSFTANMTFPALSTFTGTVLRTGFSTFAPGSAGAYACPDPAIGPANVNGLCAGLRFAFADAAGNYRLRLSTPNGPAPTYSPATSYHVGGFIIIDGAPVGNPDDVITVPLAGVGPQSRSFSLNLSAPPAASVDVGPVGDPVTVAVTGDTVLVNVSDRPTSTILTPPPPGIEFDHGVQSFTADLPTGVTVATVTLTFDDPVPLNARWYKLRGGVWTEWPGFSRVGPNTIELTITDGDPLGDEDGAVNGFVTDPGALGIKIKNDVPVISVPAATSADAIGIDSAVVTYAASGTDTEDGSLGATCDHASGSSFPVGVTTVNCSVTDSGGQTASASFTVTVHDVDFNNDGIRDTAPPSNKDQCKGNGWRGFNNPSFKNQGDCVSYTNHH